MKRLIHTLIDRLRALSLLSSMNSGSPGPRLPLALLALTAPFLLSGPIRTVTSLSLGLSLCLALVFCIAVAIALWPWLRRDVASLRAPGAWVSEGMALLVLGFAIWALYNRDFGGFMNLDGWDGGSHIFIRDKFATLVPSMYQGQVSCYALTWWIEKLF